MNKKIVGFLALSLVINMSPCFPMKKITNFFKKFKKKHAVPQGFNQVSPSVRVQKEELFDEFRQLSDYKKIIIDLPKDSYLHDVALSPDGIYIAVIYQNAEEQRCLRIIDIYLQKRIKEISLKRYSTCVDWSSGGLVFINGSSEVMIITNYTTWKSEKLFSMNDHITSLKCSPGGELFGVINKSGLVKIYSIKKKRFVFEKKFDSDLNAHAFLNNFVWLSSNYVVVMIYGQPLNLCNLEKNTVILDQSIDDYKNFSCSSSGKTVFIGGNESVRSAVLSGITDKKLVWEKAYEIYNNKNIIHMSASSGIIAVEDYYGNCLLLSIDGKKKGAVERSNWQNIQRLKWNSTGERLVIGMSEGRIIIYDFPKLKPVSLFQVSNDKLFSRFSDVSLNFTNK